MGQVLCLHGIPFHIYMDTGKLWKLPVGMLRGNLHQTSHYKGSGINLAITPHNGPPGASDDIYSHLQVFAVMSLRTSGNVLRVSWQWDKCNALLCLHEEIWSSGDVGRVSRQRDKSDAFLRFYEEIWLSGDVGRVSRQLGRCNALHRLQEKIWLSGKVGRVSW